MATGAASRPLPTREDARAWHAQIYAGCAVPVAGYIGHFRGDPLVAELLGYEVGVGLDMPDGLPEKVGVGSHLLDAELIRFIRAVRAGLGVLDAHFPPGSPATAPDQVSAVLQLAALVHGEWVRMHPFASGNGRTARAWVAFVLLRYGLPVFVTVKRRPGGVDYARAAASSMGRPPDFTGRHDETLRVFMHMLATWVP